MWHVEDVRDVILIVFVSNAIYVEDRSNTPKGCNAMYVKNVEDRSNTPKGCNAMYVGDALIYTVFDGMVKKP